MVPEYFGSDGFSTYVLLSLLWFALFSSPSRFSFASKFLCTINRLVLTMLNNDLLTLDIRSPIEIYWQFPSSTSTKGKCFNETDVTFVGSVFKNVIDLIIPSLSIPLIMRMNMPRHQKFGVGVLLGVGYLVAVNGTVRLYYTWRMLHSYDTTWEQYPAFLTGSVESHLAVVSCFIQ
jgi:hypothetical protein